MSRTTIAQRKAEAKNIMQLLKMKQPEVEARTDYKLGKFRLALAKPANIFYWSTVLVAMVTFPVIGLLILDVLSAEVLTWLVYVYAIEMILLYFMGGFLTDCRTFTYSKTGLQELHDTLGQVNVLLDEFHEEQEELQPLLQKFEVWRPLVENSLGGKMIVHEVLRDFHVELYLTKFELVEGKALRIEVTSTGYRQMVDLILAESNQYNSSLVVDELGQTLSQLEEMEKEGGVE